MLRESTLSQEGLEHGSLRLLELKEQRVAVVPAQQKQNPGPSADAPDADDLPRGVNVAVAFEKFPPIRWERLGVRGDHPADDRVELRFLGRRQHVLNRRDQRGVADDPQFTVDRSTELGERPHAVLRSRLGQIGLHPTPCLDGQLGRETLNDPVGVQTCVPDVDVSHHRKARHRLAVGARGRRYDQAPRLLIEPEIPSGDGEARRKPLHVPLERSRQRLVEIIDAEHEPTIRGGEDPEIGEVRVAAQLSMQSSSCSVREVCRHDVGPATEKGKRRNEHSPVTNRHQLRQAGLRLLLEQFYWVAANRGRFPASMRGTWHLSPGSLAARTPLRNGEATGRPRFEIRARTLPRRTGTQVGADHDSASLRQRPATRHRPERVNNNVKRQGAKSRGFAEMARGTTSPVPRPTSGL